MEDLSYVCALEKYLFISVCDVSVATGAVVCI